MKAIFLLGWVLLGTASLYAQDNFELSTMRVGAYKVLMTDKQADSVQGSPLRRNNEADNEVVVMYAGQPLKVYFYENYNEEGKQDGYYVYRISTTSKKFKTKSGMGVGNSYDELISAYKNYPNFSVYQGWNENGEKALSERYLTLHDYDAGTSLQFKLVNGVVAEVSAMIEEGT